MSSQSDEIAIFNEFLLAPASLRNFLTLEEFAEYFPQSQREKPVIKELYRELHRLRKDDTNAVRSSIVEEVKRSKQLKRAYQQQRLRDDRTAVAGLDMVALDMEEELSGYSRRKKPRHTLQTVQPAIEEATEAIEAQIGDLEAEIQAAVTDAQEVVGALSDLRYGSFKSSAGSGNVTEEVLAVLKRLEATCTNPAD